MSALDDLPISVYNTSASDIPAFGIVQIDYSGGGSDYFDGVTYLKVTKPDTTYRFNSYMVAGRAGIKATSGGIAYFGTHGCVWALYDSSYSPTQGDVYGPGPSSHNMIGNFYGFRVVGKVESASSVYRCLVKAETVTSVYGQLSGSLSYQSYATASVRRFVSGSSQPDSSFTVTAYDGYLASGKSLASGTRIALTEFGGKAVVTQSSACPS